MPVYSPKFEFLFRCKRTRTHKRISCEILTIHPLSSGTLALHKIRFMCGSFVELFFPRRSPTHIHFPLKKKISSENCVHKKFSQCGLRCWTFLAPNFPAVTAHQHVLWASPNRFRNAHTVESVQANEPEALAKSLSGKYGLVDVFFWPLPLEAK